MKTFFKMLGLAVCLAARSHGALGSEKDFTLRVVNEDGAPVEKFEVMVLVNRDWTPEWTPGEKGEVRVIPPAGLAEIDVVVRAEGFASTLKRFADEELKKWWEGGAPITLARGEEVEVRFKVPNGLSWPADLVPQFYFAEHEQHVANAWPAMGATGSARDLNMLGGRMTEPGRARVRAAKNSPPFAVSIHARGFLRFCNVGPFSALDVKEGVLEAALPEPAALEIELDPGKIDKTDLPYESATFRIALQAPGARSFTFVEQKDATGPRPELRAADLPRGDYLVMVNTQPKTPKGLLSGEADPGAFRDFKQFSLTAGGREKVSFAFVPFDADAFRGERTAVLHVSKFDGASVAGKTAEVIYADPHYGMSKVFSAEIPPSGIVEVPKLTDKKSGSTQAAYMVRVEGEHVGHFRFNSNAGNEDFAFKLPPNMGDVAPDAELTSVGTGEPLSISALRGKVVCIDFWATWCGPCQQPMEHLNDLAAGKRDAWKDRVVILPISIDDRREDVPEHLAARGWTNLDHYWAGGDAVGWKSAAAQAYGISGVPTSLILDRDGTILWRGHPADTRGGTIESRIEAALR